MTILFNTDKTINGDERNRQFFSSQIAEKLDNYKTHITRIEVHLSDQNGKKEGWNDILCLLEARLEGIQPIVATNQANTVELAISGAIEKLKGALESVIDRLKNHHQ